MSAQLAVMRTPMLVDSARYRNRVSKCSLPVSPFRSCPPLARWSPLKISSLRLAAAATGGCFIAGPRPSTMRFATILCALSASLHHPTASVAWMERGAIRVTGAEQKQVAQVNGKRDPGQPFNRSRILLCHPGYLPLTKIQAARASGNCRRSGSAARRLVGGIRRGELLHITGVMAGLVPAICVLDDKEERCPAQACARVQRKNEGGVTNGRRISRRSA
jgi:hypothetical protein